MGSILGTRVFKVIAFACFLLACCLLVACFACFLLFVCFILEPGGKAEKQSREAPLRVMFPLRFRYVSVTRPLRFRYVSVTFPLRFRGAPPRGPCQGQV